MLPGALRRRKCLYSPYEDIDRHESVPGVAPRTEQVWLGSIPLVSNRRSARHRFRHHELRAYQWLRCFYPRLGLRHDSGDNTGEWPQRYSGPLPKYLPSHLETTVIHALHQFADILEAGALIVIDEARVRARILPLRIKNDSNPEA